MNFSTDSFFAYSLPSRFRERIILSFLSVAAALAAVLQASVLLATLTTATAPHTFFLVYAIWRTFTTQEEEKGNENKIVFRTKIVSFLN